jgi:hypothetical protein
VFNQSWMGQWSELEIGRILASKGSPSIIIDFDITNLSGLHVI